MSGHINGGQQPVTNSAIQLYAVGTTAGGSTALPLLATNSVTSDGAGNFSITGQYNCPTTTSLVYIVATEGSSGSGNNPNLALAAALGNCTALKANANTTFIFMDELTTISAAYALAPFAGGTYTAIGANTASPIGLTGITNAFASASTLVNTTLGAVAAPATGVTLPAAELNTLADIIASCVNSNGTASACTTLLGATGTNNTFDAALAIAKNPGSSSITALYALASSTAPFQPTLPLTSAPNDFTVAVRYAGAELQGPSGIAIDANGNAFVTNGTGFSIVGAPPLSTTFATAVNTAAAAGGVQGPQGIAIDTTGSLWIANTGGANVVKLAPLATSSVATFPSSTSQAATLSGSAADAPVAVATDVSGNAYVVDSNSNKVYAITPGAVATGFTSALLAFPTSIAYSPNGNLQIGNALGQICVMPIALAAPTCTTQSVAQAITSVSYVLGSTTSAGYATSTTGTALSGAYGPVNGLGPFNGGGSVLPAAIAFDATGKAFLANSATISEFAAGTAGTAVSPAMGYGTVSSPSGIAIDPSGNVWTANTGDNSLSIFVGLAAPTVTPVAANNP
jgi:streptogramin lyase